MNHGHELRGRNAGVGVCRAEVGIQGRKKWDNCKSIINIIYLNNH